MLFLLNLDHLFDFSLAFLMDYFSIIAALETG